MKKFLGKSLKNIILLAVIAGFFVSGAVVFWLGTLKLPDFESIEERRVLQSTKIYDRTGEILLHNASENIRRTVVPYEDISRHIKNATIAIEDVEFFNHKGVRPLAIVRALFLQPLRGKGIQGGSTITQQVVKNTLLTQERLVSRKLKEMALALKLEQVKTKDEILEIYLNESPYGGTIYGVEEASQAFFGKSASEVTLAEASYLAALPQAPTYYSPYGNNLEDLEERRSIVLERMAEVGFITNKEAESAKATEVVFRQQQEQGIKAPHFVMYVREYIEQKYGKDAVETKGLKVTTTLDWELQKKAEAIVADYGAQNVVKFNANNAGMIGLDPTNGHLLVMVGSKDYFDTENEGNFNVTLSHRQPGSSFKPFVYAAAFEKGYTPDTVVFDLPTEFSAACNPDGTPKPGVSQTSCYMPVNYDGAYKGPMSLRDALAQSVNVPAVKTLYLVGLRDAIRMSQKLGIESLVDPSIYGLTLVLGGGEVSLLEMSSAYGVFANDGIKHPTVPILKIEDIKGNILEEYTPKPQKVLDSNIARLISNVLSDNTARTPAFGAASPLYFGGRPVAAKTGTTNDYRDAWIMGYTDNFVLGTWVGNNDNSPMEKKVAGFVVAPMWHAFFEEVLEQRPSNGFKSPQPTSKDLKPILRGIWQGGDTSFVNVNTGDPVDEETPEVLRQEIVSGDTHSILFWVDKDNPLGPAPKNPAIDPQFILWETPVQKWLNPVNQLIIPQP